MMFIISLDLGNEHFLSLPAKAPPPGNDALCHEFVYFDVKMIWLTDRLLILSQVTAKRRAEPTSMTFVCISLRIQELYV